MVLFMLCSLAWGVLIVTDTLEVWHAVVILTLHGFAGVFWAPASQMLIHDIAGRDNLHSAVRLIAMSRTLGLLGGPAVGGAMLLMLGPWIGMLVNMLIYLPLTAVALERALRPGIPRRSAEAAGGGRPRRRHADRARHRRQSHRRRR